MTTTDLDLASAYFMRRLATARAAQIPASMQFDLARSPIPDDELEEAVDAFRENAGQGARSHAGWGFAPILQELLTREPASVPVDDLKLLQSNLKRQGYLPPDYEPTGTWDPSVDHVALRRFERDNHDEQMRGHHVGAAPIEAGLRLITNTLPSRVFQGIVGSAKGVVQQTPETFERAGALGGAAAGAGIGAAVGSVVPGAGTLAGAGIGALVGGVGGFLADLFGEDEGEEGQTDLSALIDALSPFQEYGANPKAFFEDLGYVASAASLIAGAGVAGRGFMGALGSARAAQAAGTPIGQSLIARSGPAEPGWFTRIAAAATKPVLGSNRVERMVDLVRAHGLNAQATRPAFRMVNGLYTGAAAGQTASRLAAGFQSGAERTTIEQAILETPTLPDWVDVLGAVLYPQQWFPVKARQVAGAATRLMGNTDLLPFAHVIQTERKVSLRDAVGQAKEVLGADEFEQAVTSTWLRYQYGIDRLAAEKVAGLGHAAPGLAADAAFTKARAATIAAMRREVTEVPVPELAPTWGTKVAVGGKPKRVFHGTQTDFRRFERFERRGIDQYGKGFYFTESPRIASEYALGAGVSENLMEISASSRGAAQKRAEELAEEAGKALGSVERLEGEPGNWLAILFPKDGVPNVHVAYLDIRNPYPYEAKSLPSGVRAAIEEAVAKGRPITSERSPTGTGVAGFAIPADATAEQAYLAIQGTVGRDQVNRVLGEAGFDGIKVTESAFASNEKATTWIAFKGRQAHAAFDGPFLKSNVVAGESLAEEILSRSFRQPVAFEAWLRDTTLDRLPGYLKAERVVLDVRRDIRAGTIDISEQVQGFVADAEASFNRLKLTREIDGARDKLADIEKAASVANDPAAIVAMEQEATALKARIEELRAKLPPATGEPRTLENLVIAPERLDTPTSRDLKAFADEFDGLRAAVLGADKDKWQATAIARMHLTEYVDDLAHKGVIPRDLAERAKSVKRPSGAIRDHLRKKARYAAADIKLPDQVTAELKALGYKPVVTSGDVVMTTDVQKLGEITGAGDYTRRASLVETLGLSPRWQSDESLFKLREGSEVSELEQLFSSAPLQDLKFTGRQVRDKLYSHLSSINHRSVNYGPLSIVKGERPRLPKVDIRDLTPEDITLAFDDVAKWGDDTSIEVYKALRRGAAYGAEVKLLKPTETMRVLGRALRLNGLPGFSDVIRGYRVENPNLLVAASVGAGAGLGALEGDEPSDIVKGALGGLAVGAGAKVLAARSYGYLPDKLARVNTALRYTFSLTFDAGRYSEQNLIAMTKHGLPPMLSPRKHVKTRTWRSPYARSVETRRGITSSASGTS